MRAHFHQDLDDLRGDVATMCGLAGSVMAHATRGLLDVDADAAGAVHADVARLRHLHNGVERRTLGLLAKQAPVAGDLRTVVTAIHVAADADRMGGLGAHVAKTCLRRHPDTVIPDQLGGTFRRMGAIAVELAERCRHHVLGAGYPSDADRDADGFGEPTMDDLHRRLFAAVMDPTWQHGSRVAIDVVLLGRFYGRFADHAEVITRRVSSREVAVGN